VLKAQLDAQRTLSLLLVSIAAVALFVGGIGVMNVMLASVTQRTREIGVRLSVGATGADILAPFLAEGLVLCFTGAPGGVALSEAGAIVLTRVLDWQFTLSPMAVLGAVASSTAVGLAFGLFAAIKASRMDPVVALRGD
jgi:ABC-type antimicrobial peptide transport system permease subunit